MRSLFKFESIKVMAEDKLEFKNLLTDLNMKRCKASAIGVLVINVAMIIIDLKIYKPLRPEGAVYTNVYYAHITEAIITLLWLAFLKLSQKYGKRNYESAFLYFYVNLVLYFCVFFGLSDLSLNGQISSYLICVLTINALLCIKPLNALIMNVTSLIVFLAGLHYFVKDTTMFYNHSMDAFIAIFFSMGASTLNYSGFVKDYLNKKHLLESKNELQIVNQKLNEYENLRTDFFANISHELRTPLNVIYSAQQMIAAASKDNYSNAKMQKYIKMIKQNSNRLLRLINNLIDITKIDAANFEINFINSDIIKVVEDITMSVVDYIEHKGINIIFDTEIEEKTIACDPELIERILLNLLANAVKFTEEGGSIFVNIYLKDENVLISVKDTGTGIPEDMLDLIFDRFIQADKCIARKREGSGLGLSLVKSLVTMHGGNISVKSKLGAGSEFTVSLPDKKIAADASVVPKEIGNYKVEKINVEFSDIYE